MQCPKCGHPAKAETDQRCRQCGAELAAVDPSDTRLNEAQPTNTAGPSIASPPEMPPIRLEYQHLYLYEGQHGMLPIRLTNMGTHAIQEVDFSIDCMAFCDSCEFRPFKTILRKDDHSNHLSCDFDIREKPGPYMVRVKGYCLDEEGTPYAYHGNFKLIIRPRETKDHLEKPDIIVKDSYGMMIDADAARQVVIEGVYGGDIKIGDTSSATDNNNDAIDRNLQDQDWWIEIRLEKDIDRTMLLRIWFEQQKNGAPKGTPPDDKDPVVAPEPNDEEIIPEPNPSPDDNARSECVVANRWVMQTSTNGKPFTTVIWTRSTCHIGREEPPSDIACCLLPCQDDSNHTQNKFISKQHLCLHIDRTGVDLEDLNSLNGTTVDGRKIAQRTPLYNRQVIGMAHVLRLRYQDFRRLRDTRDVRQSLHQSTTAQEFSTRLFNMDIGALRNQTPIDAFVLRREQNWNWLQYLFILDKAVVGTSSDAAIRLSDDSVDAQHARLLLRNGALYIEDLDSRLGTFVGGKRLPPGMQAPVGAETRLRFGEVEGSLRIYS